MEENSSFGFLEKADVMTDRTLLFLAGMLAVLMMIWYYQEFL